MAKITPCRIVLYKLTEADVDRISQRRLASYADSDTGNVENTHTGNSVHVGEMYPLIVTRVWPEDTHGVNGQVLLDGNDTLWVTSVAEGNDNGQWSWPVKEA